MNAALPCPRPRGRAATTALALFPALAAAEPLTLDQLLQDVDARAPQLAVEAEEVAAAEAAVGIAGAWEDPTVSLMVESIPLEPGEDGPMPMVTYRLMQPLNVFGRRALAKDAARALLRAAKARQRRVTFDVRAEAVSGFYELWRNHEMEALLHRQLETLRRMRDSAKARYAAGAMMAHHEVLRAEAELSRMEAELEAIRAERPALAAMLNVLRGRDAAADVGKPLLPSRPPLDTLDEALARAERRPELESMRAMRDEMDARARLSRRMYWPMPMLGAFFEQRPGGEPSSFGGELAFNIPLWWFDRQANEVAMAEAMRRRAERAVEAMRAMTASDVRAAWSRAQSANLALEAIEGDALPRFREAVASAQAEYAAGSGDFLRLLESVMALYALEAQRLEAVVRREVARAELERLVGPAEAKR